MMPKILNINQAVRLIFLLFIFSLWGISSYKGSISCYLLFDVCWLIVLLSALCYSQTYIIFYAHMMLFLGFWFKLMGYLILNVYLIEPTGYWKSTLNSPGGWDRVLMISCLAACGILLANFLFHLVVQKKKRQAMLRAIPNWYLKYSNLAWGIIFLVGVTTNLINIYYQIYFTGLKPQIILPFHLNAILIGTMVLVIPLCISAFLGWESSVEQKKMRFYWVCTLALLTSISISSRAVFVFWTSPYILVLISHSKFSLKNIIWKNYWKMIVIYIMYAVLSFTLVSYLRAHYYAEWNPNLLYDTSYDAPYNAPYDNSFESEQFARRLALAHQQFGQLKMLIIGRWVGLEATMATTAYPGSNWLFFKNSLLEKPSAGEVGRYTHHVLKNIKYNNSNKTMFSSLPGLVGILNYAGSLWLIFGGMTSICLLLCYVEFISYSILQNKFLLSQQGLILSYWCISGLNIPYLGVINLLECASIVLFLSMISPVYNFFAKHRANKTSIYPI